MCSTGTVRLLHNPEQKQEDLQLQNRQKLIERYLYAREYEEGLQAALDAIKRFPERPALTHSWALDFLLSLERKKEAIDILEHGLHHGACWSPKLIRAGWGELEDQPEFLGILETCRRQFKEKAVLAKAEVIVRTPEKYSLEKDYPLIVILHGAYSNNDNSQHVWMKPLSKRSILQAFLQSSQIMSSDHFVWDNEGIALRDMKNALLMLEKNYRIKDSEVILGGVSRGAEIVLLSIFSGNMRANGFISVIPSVGTFMKRFVGKKNLLTKRDLRGFIVAGEKDPRYHKTKRVFNFLKERGIPCLLHSVPETGHAIPEDFDTTLERAMAFVMKGKSFESFSESQ